MKFSSIVSILGACGAAFVFSSCASVSVRGMQTGGPVTKPARVWVAPFSTTGSDFRVAGRKSSGEIESFKRSTAQVLQEYTVGNVSKHVAPASAVPAGAHPHGGGWLVTGHLTRVNTGSRGLRVGVGLGAGGTKMETMVEVYDLARKSGRPFLRFSTSGGSNAMPGLLTSTGPGSAAFSMVSQASTGVTDDAARTSRMIAGALSEYMAQQGWISSNKIFHTKKDGQFQLIHGM